MKNQRNQFRIPVSRRGLVTQGKKTTLCAVLDLTEQGLRFSADLPLTMGETVSIECQLDGDCIIHCELLVIHAEPPHFGGHITQLLPEHRQQLEQFIERLALSNTIGI